METSDKETIYKLIEEIKQAKSEANRFPTFSTFSELVRLSKKPAKIVKKELNQLVIDKKISFGMTINDIYFYICEK